MPFTSHTRPAARARRPRKGAAALYAAAFAILSALALAWLPAPGAAVSAQTGDDGPTDVPLLISEFRLRGAQGANDEFVEIYNNSDAPVTVNAGDGSSGYALVASDGSARCVIPNGTVIPARGHFLCVNGVGYSLSGYPAGHGATAAGDASYTADIPDNAAPTSCTGLPQDTGDNASDFIFVDTNGTSAGAGQRLGAPGVLANDADADGDALTAALVSGPAHGTLALDPDGSFTYTPDAHFAGADSFTYRADDGEDASNVATVHIQVRDTEAPTLAASVAVSSLRQRDSTLVNVGLSASADDNGGGPVRLSVEVFGDEDDEAPTEPGGRPRGQKRTAGRRRAGITQAGGTLVLGVPPAFFLPG